MIDNGDTAVLRRNIRRFLGFSPCRESPTLQTVETTAEQGYRRALVSYSSPDGDRIPAYLFLPDAAGLRPAVLVHHQHNGERFLGKSEVCGLAGDSLQAFAPALAARGVVVLAPDSICFEDRRRQRSGRKPDSGADWLQHYNEMAYRLLSGDLLMRKVLADSALALTVLESCEFVDRTRIGMLGHSYGGNTVLFHAALDERVRFACSSGAAGSYAAKMANDTGIEQAQVIPGFAQRWDIHDLVACIAPRSLLLVSATDDPYSCDAPTVEVRGRWAYSAMSADAALEHLRFAGGHALTHKRFARIVEWVTNQCWPSGLQSPSQRGAS
jgi:dienelactone hydrolase